VNAGLNIAVVICAAGSSSRMGGVKKEYQKLKNGDTVLGSSVRVFASVKSIKTIVIAVNKDTEADARGALPQKFLASDDPKIFFVSGGSSRSASVFNALSFLMSLDSQAAKINYALIHDGARPYISAPLTSKIIEAVQKNGAVVPVMPVTETPKEIGSNGFIKRHLKRVSIGAAQTPQAFKFPQIYNAHKKAAKVKNTEFTDDAEIWGRFCGKVAVIDGEAENKKITFKEDLN